MTNTNPIIQKTIKELIVECHDDHVGLWSVIAALEHNGIKADPVEPRQIATKVICALLDEKDIVAFNYHKPNYYIWDLTPEDAIMRINKEWDQLGHNPKLNDSHIVWFTSKDMAAHLGK